MKIKTNYHGEVEINEQDILTIKGGMLGYEHLTKFVLIKEEDLFVEYLQSIEEKVAFAIMNPFLVKKDYMFDLPDATILSLNISKQEDVVIKSVVVIPEDITKIRTNLQAPIIFNKNNNTGVQIILDDSYPMRYEFFDKGGKSCSS